MSSGKRRDDSLLKRLVVPAAYTPSEPKKAPVRVCLLTSTAALELLEEKDKKRKRELKLKEQTEETCERTEQTEEEKRSKTKT